MLIHILIEISTDRDFHAGVEEVEGEKQYKKAKLMQVWPQKH